MTDGPLILASASRARSRLLAGAGLEFQTCPADIDEAAIRDQGLAAGHDAARIAGDLATAKARAVATRSPGALVLGSDQVLLHGDALLSKPDDRSEAGAQLRRLRDGTHKLVSAAAILRDQQLLWRHAQSVELSMRDFSDAFLDDYLDRAGDVVLGSVGTYHLEGLGAQLFTRVDGDYFTVLGLPLLAVLQALRDIGYLDV